MADESYRRLEAQNAALDHAGGSHSDGYRTREPYHAKLGHMAKVRHRSRMGRAGSTKAAQMRAKSKYRR